MTQDTALPEHLTRKEVARVLRLSPRQVDTLAKQGKLKKKKLSDLRSGFARDEIDRYLRQCNSSDRQYYRSKWVVYFMRLPWDDPKAGYAAGLVIDDHLSKRLPGCSVTVDGTLAMIHWPPSLKYTKEEMERALDELDEMYGKK